MLSLKKEGTTVVNALGQRIWRLRLWSNSLLGDIRQIVSDASLELFPHLQCQGSGFDRYFKFKSLII